MKLDQFFLSFIFLFFGFAVVSSQTCQLQLYKNEVTEGPYHYSGLSFVIKRKTFICVENNTIFTFDTERQLFPPVSHFLCALQSSFGNCDRECSSRQVTLSIKCKDTTTNQDTYVQIRYVNKNCNKPYWSSWNQITSCNNSRKAIFTRSAKDCDNVPITKYLVNGYKREEICQPTWSNWTYTLCLSADCNSDGRRERKRECLYGDGSRETNTTLCSNDTSIVNEFCVVNKSCSSTFLNRSTTKTFHITMPTPSTTSNTTRLIKNFTQAPFIETSSTSFPQTKTHLSSYVTQNVGTPNSERITRTPGSETTSTGKIPFTFAAESSTNMGVSPTTKLNTRTTNSGTIFGIVFCCFLIIILLFATSVLVKKVRKRKMFDPQLDNGSAEIAGKSDKKSQIERTLRNFIACFYHERETLQLTSKNVLNESDYVF